VVDRIERATHHAEPVTLVRLGTALPGQPCRAKWRCDHALTVRAAFADRPGDQQQDEEDGEPQNSKCPGRNRQLSVRLGLEERQSQGHTRSVAVPTSWWAAPRCVRLLPDLAGPGHHILGRGHFGQTHRATRVQLLRRDADFGSEAELASVDEPT
jgi:hypothetical protein